MRMRPPEPRAVDPKLGDQGLALRLERRLPIRRHERGGKPGQAVPLEPNLDHPDPILQPRADNAPQDRRARRMQKDRPIRPDDGRAHACNAAEQGCAHMPHSLVDAQTVPPARPARAATGRQRAEAHVQPRRAAGRHSDEQRAKHRLAPRRAGSVDPDFGQGRQTLELERPAVGEVSQKPIPMVPQIGVGAFDDSGDRRRRPGRAVRRQGRTRRDRNIGAIHSPAPDRPTPTRCVPRRRQFWTRALAAQPLRDAPPAVQAGIRPRSPSQEPA